MNDKHNPKVSIIIPSFNSAIFLPDALDSISCQTFNDFEVVVVDDGSSDNTRDVLHPYFNNQFNIKYIYQENKGLPAARNTGIVNSCGLYISLLDADDIFLPTHLEELVSFLDEEKQLGFVFADSYLFHCNKVYSTTRFEKSRIYEIECEIGFNNRKIFNRSIARELIWGSFIPNCTALIRRCVFDDIGLYDENFLNCEDREFWLRADAKYRSGYIDHPLAKVRLHDNNITNKKNSIKMLSFGEKVVKNYSKLNKDLLGPSDIKNIDAYLSKVNFDLGWAYMKIGNKRLAEKYYKESLTYLLNYKAYKELILLKVGLR